jgi:hypothetical protein
MLQDKVAQLSTDVGRLVGEVSAFRSASAGIQTALEGVSDLKTQIGQKLNDPVLEQLSPNFIELRKEVLTLKAQIAVLSPTVTPSQDRARLSSPAVSSGKSSVKNVNFNLRSLTDRSLNYSFHFISFRFTSFSLGFLLR